MKCSKRFLWAHFAITILMHNLRVSLIRNNVIAGQKNGLHIELMDPAHHAYKKKNTACIYAFLGCETKISLFLQSPSRSCMYVHFSRFNAYSKVWTHSREGEKRLQNLLIRRCCTNMRGLVEVVARKKVYTERRKTREKFSHPRKNCTFGLCTKRIARSRGPMSINI